MRARGQTAIGSLRASARLTRRRWWRTLGFSALIDVIAILSGPLLGVLLLLPTSRSLTVIDVTGSIVYALVVPYAAAALTLLLPRPAGARGARTRRAHSERSDPMITLSPTKQYRQGCSCEPPGTTSSGAARSPQPGSLASSS